MNDPGRSDEPDPPKPSRPLPPRPEQPAGGVDEAADQREQQGQSQQ